MATHRYSQRAELKMYPKYILGALLCLLLSIPTFIFLSYVSSNDPVNYSTPGIIFNNTNHLVTVNECTTTCQRFDFGESDVLRPRQYVPINALVGSSNPWIVETGHSNFGCLRNFVPNHYLLPTITFEVSNTTKLRGSVCAVWSIN